MENQKKAAEAEAAQSILTAVSSASGPACSSNNAAEVDVVEAEPAAQATEANSAPSATHATATAPVEHEDFGEESSDDSESGIAFLPTVGAPSSGKKTRGPAKDKGSKTNNAAAAAAAVMSLQRTHWTKEMVRTIISEFIRIC